MKNRWYCRCCYPQRWQTRTFKFRYLRTSAYARISVFQRHLHCPKTSQRANSRPSALMASLANGPWSVDDLGVKGLTCDLSADPNGFVVAISARTENLNPNTRIIVEYPSADVWVNNGLTSRKNASFRCKPTFSLTQQSRWRATVLSSIC